jgi:hypothetical protein
MARNIVLPTITAVFDIVVLTIGGSLFPSYEKNYQLPPPTYASSIGPLSAAANLSPSTRPNSFVYTSRSTPYALILYFESYTY